jgi:hypothetical protein
MRNRHVIAAAGLAAVLAVGLAGCGSSGPGNSGSNNSGTGNSSTGNSATGASPGVQETNPVGDIPDNTAFVAYRPAGGQYEIKVPEGWARTASGAAVSFTDKLNTVRVETMPAPAAPTVASARATEVPAIQGAAARFTLQKVETVKRKAGDAVLITYKADSPVDPVTGKVVPDAVERYEFWKGGTEAVVTLTGPVKADYVDPWRTVTDSFKWLS